jgi:hypothetical protein
MAYGENDGAIGYLIGEENRGLNCMFTMMNQARLMVGVQGVGVAERAFQHALAYAGERKQGKRPGSNGAVEIIHHPDIKRQLLSMRALTQASRAICLGCAVAIDLAERAEDEETRAALDARVALLTPIAKAFSTDAGVEVASLGVQVHGGMGYIEETGAAQFLRDARIAPIYEGTNGIQAIDLVTRKLTVDGGAAVTALIEELTETANDVMASNNPALGQTGYRLNAAIEALEEATSWLQGTLPDKPDHALAGAAPYLSLFGLAVGGAALARGALEAHKDDANGAAAGAATLARFFAEHHLPAAEGLSLVVRGAGEVIAETGADALAM